MRSGCHVGSLYDLSCLLHFPVGGVPFASFGHCMSPGVAHFQADALSGVPLVGRFASLDVALLPLFYSRIPGPQVLAVDAFSVPRPVGLLFAFPPIPLLPGVLWKFREVQCTVIWLLFFDLGGCGLHTFSCSMEGPFPLPVRPPTLHFPALSARQFRQLALKA